MQTRVAVETDCQALEDVLVSVYGERLRTLAQNYIACAFSQDYRRPSFIVAVSSTGDVVGTAALSEELFSVGIWGISWVAVLPQFRRQGIGQSLVEACLKEIAQMTSDPATVVLATYPGKTELYTRCGFQQVSSDDAQGSLMVRYLS